MFPLWKKPGNYVRDCRLKPRQQAFGRGQAFRWGQVFGRGQAFERGNGQFDIKKDLFQIIAWIKEHGLDLRNHISKED